MTIKLNIHLLAHRDAEDDAHGIWRGLLAAQYSNDSLDGALVTAMTTLGASDGVLAQIAKACREAGVPCGLLGLLPLHAALVPAAVPGGEVEPLLDVVQVSYAPSARIWAACRQRATATPGAAPVAVVVGNPLPQPQGIPPLEGAEAEVVRDFLTQVPQSRPRYFPTDAATRPAVLAALQEVGPTLTHAHFACHGLADLADPDRSGLLLANGERLMVRDLLVPAEMRFERLRLAVLSACQTGLPGMDLPDEVVGLPAGWLQAGAAGVVASLWPVSDAATVALMTKFYELHLLDGLEPGQALWLAQRWLRGLPTWREDCQAAGATLGATGRAVREVVRELQSARRGVEEVVSADRDLATSPEEGESDNRGSADNPRYWAAFALYGV